MKFIPLHANREMRYPIGVHIQYNWPVIQCMQNKLLEYLLKEQLKNKIIQLFCMGSSGSIISSLIASHLISNEFEVTIHYIQKEGESRHGGNYDVDDAKLISINIIVDDFIITGETIRKIYRTMIDRNIEVHGVMFSGTCSYDAMIGNMPDLKFTICEKLYNYPQE